MNIETILTDILRPAVQNDTSDIFVAVGSAPRYKIHGAHQTFTDALLTDVQVAAFIRSMISEDQYKVLEQEKELDFAFQTGTHRFRGNAFYQQGCHACVMRTIPTSVKSATELNIPEEVVRLAEAPRGLVLVTGPTGSGKSTTLAAMIDHINSNYQKNIITIEDPIEFPHQHKRSIIQQREVGRDTRSFAKALKSALRQAPDVILVGEMRDYDTISAALTAAETGHLVMGTMHTNSAAESMNRIIDVFPEEQQAQVRTQLASSLVGVMTQQILPNSQGSGRVMAYELMINMPAIAANIKEGKVAAIITAMQTNSEKGMVTMDQCLTALAARNVITTEVARKKAMDPQAIDTGLRSGIVPRQAMEHAAKALQRMGGASASGSPAYGSAQQGGAGTGAAFGRNTGRESPLPTTPLPSGGSPFGRK